MIRGDTHKYPWSNRNENAPKTKKNDILPSCVSAVRVIIINIIVIYYYCCYYDCSRRRRIVKGSYTIRMNRSKTQLERVFCTQ